jgi:hypothetical protein
MTDEQDVTIAVLNERLQSALKRLDKVEATAQSLNNDRMRIEGGKWVLWVLGGLVVGGATLWYSLTNSPSIARVFHPGAP